MPRIQAHRLIVKVELAGWNLSSQVPDVEDFNGPAKCGTALGGLVGINPDNPELPLSSAGVPSLASLRR
jgi:hypothetical protein